MRTFGYDPAITDSFPTIVGGEIHAAEVTNDPSPDDLVEAFRAQHESALARVGSTPLSEVPSASTSAENGTRRRARLGHDTTALSLLRTEMLSSGCP